MQHFNIWDFVSVPHDSSEDLNTFRGVDTREEAERLVREYTPTWIRRYAAEFLAIVLAKISLLDDSPSINAATQALYSEVLSADVSSENEKRYIALMKREISDDYSTAVAFGIHNIRRTTDAYGRLTKWDWVYSLGLLRNWMANIHHRCDKLVALMAKCESDSQTTPAAANPAWIREGALVENGEGIGVEVTIGPNPLSYRKTAQGGLAGFRLPADSTWFLGEFARLQFPEPDHIADRNAATTAVTLTARGGPVEYRAGSDSAAWGVLAKDVSVSWSKASLDDVVRLAMKPIAMPTVTGTLEDITLQGVGAQTVDVSSLTWAGTRLGTLTVTSSNANVATATYVSASQDIAVQGVATGTATITATRTDAAGQIVFISFDVTVTAAQD